MILHLQTLITYKTFCMIFLLHLMALIPNLVKMGKNTLYLIIIGMFYMRVTEQLLPYLPNQKISKWFMLLFGIWKDAYKLIQNLK